MRLCAGLDFTALVWHVHPGMKLLLFSRGCNHSGVFGGGIVTFNRYSRQISSLRQLISRNVFLVFPLKAEAPRLQRVAWHVYRLVRVFSFDISCFSRTLCFLLRFTLFNIYIKYNIKINVLFHNWPALRRVSCIYCEQSVDLWFIVTGDSVFDLCLQCLTHILLRSQILFLPSSFMTRFVF